MTRVSSPFALTACAILLLFPCMFHAITAVLVAVALVICNNVKVVWRSWHTLVCLSVTFMRMWPVLSKRTCGVLSYSGFQLISGLGFSFAVA